MTFLQPEAPLRLKVDGFRKPLRLRSLGRAGALETFAVEGETVQALRFLPAGAVRETAGRLTPIPEAAEAYAAGLDAFEALGRKLMATAPQAALPIEGVTRSVAGGFWLQPPVGLTLEAWMADHPGPVAEPIVAAFARRLAEALSELHAAGIVHGDLSPRAVLLDGGAVRLTGFMVDRRPFFRALRGQKDLVEPGYAPPEAHDGALRHAIGPAADLYAASALLQRLLTGQAPPPANLAARVAGDTAWPGGVATSAALRAGIEAGLAPAIEARPADAETWLAGLGLGPEPQTSSWFEGPVETPPPEPQAELLALPPMPLAEPEPEPELELEPDETPLILAREAPARGRVGRWAIVGGVSVLAVAAAGALLLRPDPRTPGRAEAPKVAIPPAPSGCQWLAAADGWRLRCADAPAQGLRLPERFDAQTTARAATGEPAAMERLGAFYRLRASETDNPNRGTYAYQALDWLQRAASAADDGRPDTARARDDAALALGQMLAHGEGGRAPDPATAGARLRQAAAGSRADAVLALGQFLESQTSGDPDRLIEARGLYARVAQLNDGSALQREAERGLARIDEATKPPPQSEVEAKPEPPAEKPVVKTPVEKPAPKPKPKPVSKAKPSPTKAEPAKRPPPVVRAPPKPAPTPPPPRIVTTAPVRPAAPKPPLRTWTASSFIKIDPTTDFSSAVELAGRAACDSEGGDVLSVRTGDTLCPNGVNYCQVRAVATCQGTRP